MKPILIIKTGGTYPEISKRFGGFDAMMIRAMGVEPSRTITIDVPKGELLPDHHSISGAVITGSHEMVTDGHVWITETAQWIQAAVNSRLPLLGICFGHQILARAMGGRVDYNDGKERMGTVDISLTTDGKTDRLFGKLPPVFPAHVSHDQSVLELPPGAVLLAEGENEAHHAFRIGNCAWGVQFHPEFTRDIMLAYLKIKTEKYIKRGWDVEQIRHTLGETREIGVLLKHFVQLI